MKGVRLEGVKLLKGVRSFIVAAKLHNERPDPFQPAFNIYFYLHNKYRLSAYA
jgi:hypothetical protein